MEKMVGKRNQASFLNETINDEAHESPINKKERRIDINGIDIENSMVVVGSQPCQHQ